jgi:hypothetical protein
MPEQNPQPPAHPIQSGQPFAILSGEKPRFHPEVGGGHKGLEQLLAQAGFQHEQTDGNYGGGSSKSPVFVVYNAPRDHVMELGRKMGQESVIFSENGQHELIYVNGKNAGRYHPSTGMEVHPSAPKEGLTTRVSGVGHVRLNFDSTKLLDVPKKEADMSHNDTQKSEVSVAEFKRKLAHTLQGQITAFSKSLEDLASREVNGNVDAVVGDFKKSHTVLMVDSPESMWVEELKKSHAMDMAVAMKRVYQSYLQNVALKQTPNDPQAAHQLAMAAAKDWASRASPQAASQMAVDSPQHNATAPKFEYPDSFGPGTAPVHTNPNAQAQEQQEAFAPPVAKAALPGHAGPVSPDRGLAQPQRNVSTAEQAAVSAPKAVPTQPAKSFRQARLPGYGSSYRKDEMKGLCKECKSEMCKCNKMGKSEACILCGLEGEGCQCMMDLQKSFEDGEWTTELNKSDEWMGKNVTASTYPSKTSVRRQNLHDIKYAEAKGDKNAAAKVVDTAAAIAAKRKGQPTLKSDDSDRIAGVHAREGAELSQIPFRDPKKGPNSEGPDHVLSIAEERKRDAKKSEDFIDLKNANARPTSTDSAAKGGPRIKNVGAETPGPAEPSKEVKGKLDEGSGGEITKGKALGKGALAPEAPSSAGAAAGSPLGASEMAKAGPPMAKPPGGNPTPGKPPMSKPKLPRKAGTMGKAAMPQSRMDAGNVQAASIRAGHESAPAPAVEAAPKAIPKPTSDYSDFMPPSKFSSGATVGPKIPTPGKLK